MKKTSMVMVLMILVIGLAACSTAPAELTKGNEDMASAATAEPTSMTEIENEIVLSPDLLLSSEYNPMYEIAWPEQYHIYQVSYEISEYRLYRVYLTTQDDADNTVTFISNLLGDSAPESIRENIEALKSDGRVEIFGTQVSAGLNADAEILKADESDSDYDATEGYVVKLIMSLQDNTEKLADLLQANFNIPAVKEFGDVFDLNQSDMRSIRINLDKGFTEAFVGFENNDPQAVKQWVDGLDDWQFNERKDAAQKQFGDMTAHVRFDADKDLIYLSETLTSTSQALREYLPKADGELNTETLKNLKFEAYENTCSYRDEEAGIWMGVYKTEWGAADGDCIMCSFSVFDQPCFVIISYPDQIYNVMLGEDDDRIDYEYDAFADTITPSSRYEDYSAFMDAFAEKTSDDSDLAPKQPVLFVDSFAEQTFGYKPEKLFELPRE